MGNDRQLACARINSEEGQNYMKGMSAAANYAWVNRSSMTFLTRQAFAKVFNQSPGDLDMHVIYDVSHNIAKVEEHMVDGHCKQLLVHRKGLQRGVVRPGQEDSSRGERTLPELACTKW